MTNDRPWYTVIVLAILAVGAGAAAFWLTAYTDASAEQFMTVFIFLAGAIAGQAIPPAVSALANRQLDAQQQPAQLVSAGPETTRAMAPTEQGTVKSVREVDQGYLTAVRWDDGTLGEHLFPVEHPEGTRVTR